MQMLTCYTTLLYFIRVLRILEQLLGNSDAFWSAAEYTRQPDLWRWGCLAVVISSSKRGLIQPQNCSERAAGSHSNWQAQLELEIHNGSNSGCGMKKIIGLPSNSHHMDVSVVSGPGWRNLLDILVIFNMFKIHFPPEKLRGISHCFFQLIVPQQ